MMCCSLYMLFIISLVSGLVLFVVLLFLFYLVYFFFFFFSSRRRHTRSYGDWSSDVCSSDLAAQGGARRILSARQARRLLGARPREERANHRRGHLRGWQRKGRTRPALPGDPAAPGEDPQRREGARRQDARERGDQGAHHRAWHRDRGLLRHQKAPLRADNPPRGRRCRWVAHPDTPLDPAVSTFQAARRRRPHLYRPAAALPAAARQRGSLGARGQRARQGDPRAEEH